MRDTIKFKNGFPKISKMASGHLALELTEDASYDTFPGYAELFLRIVGGKALKKGDSSIICIWNVVINGCEYRLVFDDYPCGISLESNNEKSDQYLGEIKRILMS